VTDNNRPQGFHNPVIVLATLLALSVIALIAAAVFGIDKGVLRNMASPEYARGLITFLFAVVTIGSALVLIVSGLIGSNDEVSDKQFQRGKEVLSLLLGVFGTIVGYYFGSIHTAGSATVSLRVSGLEVVPAVAPAGSPVTAKALLAGGTPPYRYTLHFEAGERKPITQVTENGVIAEQIAVPQSQSGKLRLLLTAEDALGREIEATATVQVVP
jgi:hypothetical protein